VEPLTAKQPLGRLKELIALARSHRRDCLSR
jgi:hypothetical protein